MIYTIQTRRESNEALDRRKRNAEVLEILDELGNATAKEVAVRMYEKGYTATSERNNAAPRLTELEQDGYVEVIGKRICRYTGKRVAIYRRAE